MSVESATISFQEETGEGGKHSSPFLCCLFTNMYTCNSTKGRRALNLVILKELSRGILNSDYKLPFSVVFRSINRKEDFQNNDLIMVTPTVFPIRIYTAS